MTAIAVTIAGSDSGGGAGIQADLKTFSANGVFGASVIAALTAQNTLGVSAIHDVPPEFVRAQMTAVFSDLAVKATKIGMLSRVDTIEVVAEGLRAHETGPVVLDPVMVAASGDPLLADSAVDTLIALLLPLADIATPNLFELEWMSGRSVSTEMDAISAARSLGPARVLVTSAPAMRRNSVSNLLVDEKSAIAAEHGAIVHAWL